MGKKETSKKRFDQPNRLQEVQSMTARSPYSQSVSITHPDVNQCSPPVDYVYNFPVFSHVEISYVNCKTRRRFFLSNLRTNWSSPSTPWVLVNSYTNSSLIYPSTIDMQRRRQDYDILEGFGIARKRGKVEKLLLPFRQ